MVTRAHNYFLCVKRKICLSLSYNNLSADNEPTFQYILNQFIKMLYVYRKDS